MIKYFSYEFNYRTNQTSNEKIIIDDPQLDISGVKIKRKSEPLYKIIIDIQKRIELYGKLDNMEQDVYNKLLQQDRNNKLNTI